MTTIAIDTDHPAELSNPDAASATGIETASPVYVGEIVTGPIRLNTGDEIELPPFRAGFLDARSLRDSPLHPRTDLGDLSDIIPSIKLFGVRDPLVVLARPVPVNELPAGQDDPAQDDAAPAPVTEVFEVLGGKRRQYAAIEAGRYVVPCVIVADEGDAFAILSALEMNSHHKDLDRIEEAGAYQMLLDLGWDERAIAKARNIDVDQVRTAVKARSLPERAQRALNSGALTFDMAQGLEEFEDSPQDVERLLDKVNKGEFDFKHTLGQLRDKRAYTRNKELAKAHLLLAGVDVTAKPRGFGYDNAAVAADDLVDADGQPVDVESAKTLPGFHAFVEKNGGQARTVVYCADPAAHGYSKKEPDPHAGLTPQEAAEQEEKQRQREAMLDGLRVATEVRREFVQRTYGSARNARKLYVDALRAANNGSAMHRSTGLDDLYRALGGLEPDVIATAGEDRLRRSLTAKFACAQERNLGEGVQGHLGWIHKTPAVAWFDRLQADGYPLSDAEHQLYQWLQPPAPEPAGEQDDLGQGDTDEDDVSDTDEPLPDPTDGDGTEPAPEVTESQSPDVPPVDDSADHDVTEYAPAA